LSPSTHGLGTPILSICVLHSISVSSHSLKDSYYVVGYPKQAAATVIDLYSVFWFTLTRRTLPKWQHHFWSAQRCQARLLLRWGTKLWLDDDSWCCVVLLVANIMYVLLLLPTHSDCSSYILYAASALLSWWKMKHLPF